MFFITRTFEWALSYTLGRYITVGGLSLLIDTCIFALLQKGFGVYFLYATLISGTIAWLFNFPMHKGWTFEDRRGLRVTGLQGSAHLSLKIGNTYLWGPYLLYVLVTIPQWDPVVAKFVVGLSLGVSNFLLCRYVIFRKPAV